MAYGAETPEKQKFYYWFKHELSGKRFDSRGGREFLKENLEKIMYEVNSHFTPELMKDSRLINFFEEPVEAVREAYSDGDYYALAEAMDLLKTRCESA